MKEAVGDNLTSALRAIRRRLLRHRRVVTAALAGICAVSALQVWSPPAPETRSVVVAARDLPAGLVLTPDDLRVAEVAAGIVPVGFSETVASLESRAIAAPVRAGEVLTDQRVVGPGLLDGYGEGMVAVPIRLPDRQAAALLSIGDHVDVLGATGDVASAANRIAVDVAVLALPAPSEFERDGALVVLAVSDSVAAALAQAAATTQLTLVIRPPP